MAEIAVNLVIGKLIPLLRYEVTLLKGVHTQAAFIKDQLGLIRAYLRDADVKAEQEENSDVVKEWVKQVREVAHRIEDVIDEYLLQIAEWRQKRGLGGVIEKIVRLPKSIEPRHVIASVIRDIKDVIITLDRMKETLGFNPTGAESSHGGTTGHDLRRGALFLEDAELVGTNDTTQQLERLLLDEDSKRTVIAVVGTGGIENNNRSRLIITTRHQGVAKFCVRSAHVHIHDLQHLCPSDAMKLLLFKAFQFKPERCPNELMELAQDIVNKCNGVPLAIVAIAGLLSTKNSNFAEWKKVHDSLGSKLANDPHLKSFNQVLSESYHDLPFHLKPCLLYFGLFPNDYSISCARLIRLWIVEAMVHVKENEDRTPEEGAEEYLYELIHRSLVTVSSEYYDDRARTCRVHDLSHKFIKKKCAELDFCRVIKSDSFTFNSTSRRLAIQFQPNKEDFASGRVDASHSRVRFCFAFNFEEMPKPQVTSVLSNFKLLVGLDFEEAPLDDLPQAIGNMLHLKYLSLKNTRIKTLPRFVGKLLNLETLDLKYTLVCELPVEINKLIKLRHLLAYSINVDIDYTSPSFQGMQIKEGIGRLKALEKLMRVDMTNGDNIVKELKSLKQLRRFGVIRLRRHNGKRLWSAIEGMTHRQALSIVAAEKHEILVLHTLLNPPHLKRLYLHGRLETVPKWIPKLRALSRLFLRWSGLTEDPLPALKELRDLLELELYNAFEGAKLYFKEGWFEKLKSLRLERMQAMTTLKMDKGALPLLERMTIGPCPQMVEVPNDIQNLETLQHLRFYEMLINSMEGKGYDMLKNIPFVIYSKGDKFYTLHNDAGAKIDDF